MSRMGSRIMSLRTAKGLTRKQLAKSVGVTEKYIEEVETGKKVINAELLTKVSKILEQSVEEAEIYETGTVVEEKETKALKKPVEQKVIQQVWHDAFDSVLKSVPVYEYDLQKVLSVRQLPVVSNKVEGYSKDKVLFLQIMDNDMIGFRIVAGDVAFGYMTQEIESNAVCLVEYAGKRVIRQVKRLDGDKLLLVYNNGRLVTETMPARELKVLARLVQLEIKL
jgi:transcriptional regulator with XRE-family HTH domain